MATEESYSPLLKSQAIISKVLEIQKKYPTLIPTDDEIQVAFESKPNAFAKALLDSYNQVTEPGEIIEKAAKSDDVNPSDPNLKQIVNRCLGYCKRGECSTRCKNAIRIYSQMSNGKQMQPGQGQEGANHSFNRITSRGARTLNTNRFNRRLQSQLAVIDADLQDEMRLNPNNHAFKKNYEVRNRAITNLAFVTERYKEQILNFNALSPYSYTRAEKAARQELFGRGAAASDMANMFLKSGHVSDTLTKVNEILSDFELNNGSLSDHGRELLGDMMEKANVHVPMYGNKVDKLMNDDSFITGYLKELQVEGEKYNKEMFLSAFEDGTPEAETMMQQALADIPLGSITAATQALTELGKKRNGEEAYDKVFSDSVYHYLKKNAPAVVKSYGNRASAQERKNILAETTLNSPFLQQKIQQIGEMNKQLEAYGQKPKWNLNDFSSLPKSMQKEIAKGTLVDLLNVEGERGVVTAAKFFGDALDEQTIQEARKESVDNGANKIGKMWDNYRAYKDVAPLINTYMPDPDAFHDLDFDVQQQKYAEMEKEIEAMAKRSGVNTDSEPYKAAKAKQLDDFKPMPKSARDQMAQVQKKMSKSISRKDGVRMYYNDIFKEPMDWISKNKKTALDMMYDDKGQMTEFGQFVDGLRQGTSSGYDHPIFAPVQDIGMTGLTMREKTPDEIQGAMKKVIDSVDPKVRDKIFNKRVQNFANAPAGKEVSQDFAENLQTNPTFAAMAKSMRVDTPESFMKLSDLVNSYESAKVDNVVSSPTDILNAAKNMEYDFESNRNMPKAQLDSMYEALAVARGQEYADKMLVNRYLSGRMDTGILSPFAEGGELGLYNPLDQANDKARLNGYKKAMLDLADFSGKTPNLARNYQPWRTYHMAEGGNQAINELAAYASQNMQPEQFYDTCEGVVRDILANTAAHTGGSSNLHDMLTQGDPAEIQRAAEYINKMKTLAVTNPQLQARMDEFMKSGVLAAPAQTPNGAFFTTPQYYQNYLQNETASSSSSFGNAPPAVVANRDSFNDFYQGMNARKTELESKPIARNKDEAAQLQAINNFQAAMAGTEQMPFAQAAEEITKKLLDGIAADPKTSIDNIMTADKDVSYADVANNNPLVRNTLDMLKLVNPGAVNKFMNRKYRAPSDIANALDTGSLFNPNADEKYKVYEERKSAMDEIERSLNNDKLFAKYSGLNPQSKAFAAKKQQMASAIAGAKMGRDFARTTYTAKNALEGISDVVSQINNLSFGQSIGLDDRSLATIPDVELRYELQEIRNSFAEEGDDDLKQMLGNLKFTRDGKVALDNSGMFYDKSKLQFVLGSMKSDKIADEQMKAILNSADNVPYNQDDIAVLNGDSQSQTTFNSPFVPNQLPIYHNAKNKVMSELGRLNAVNKQINQTESRGLSPTLESFEKVRLGAASKLYSEMTRATASGANRRQFIEAKANELMSHFAANYGIDEVNMEDLQRIGKTFMRRGNIKGALEVAAVASQMNELGAAYRDFTGIGYADKDAFLASSWGDNGRVSPY